MEAMNSRPKLVSFCATQFHGNIPASIKTAPTLSLKFQPAIEVGLAIETEKENQLQAIVKFDFVATGMKADSSGEAVEFKACYEAKYEYLAGVAKEHLVPLFEQEAYQYMLIAQSFPLAMTHFRRQLQSFGIDVRELPLGI